MSTTRRQGALVGLALGGVLSVPALLVLSLVTGGVREASATWLWVAAPLCALTAALGGLAVSAPAARRPDAAAVPARPRRR